jgi:hypothetical protein
MPFYPRSRLVRRGNAGNAGPLVIIGLVMLLGVLIVLTVVWNPCPGGTERRCGTVGTGKLIGHACECGET